MSLRVDSNLDYQNVNKPVNVPDPTAAQDVATKHYVDAIATGIILKQAVIAAAPANVNIASPGANIDGVVMGAGQRILLTAQATGSQNGIWTWNGAGVALSRPSDFQTGATEEPGTSVFVEGTGATTYTNSLFTMNTVGNVTVDTTSQSWTLSGGASTITFTAPLVQTGSNVALTLPLTVAQGGTNSTTASGARASLSATGKYATSIGDGATTTFTITHNLGTTDVEANVYDMATGALELVQTTILTNNTLSVGPFGTAPAASGGSLGSGTGKRVVVIG